MCSSINTHIAELAFTASTPSGTTYPLIHLKNRPPTLPTLLSQASDVPANHPPSNQHTTNNQPSSASHHQAEIAPSKPFPIREYHAINAPEQAFPCPLVGRERERLWLATFPQHLYSHMVLAIIQEPCTGDARDEQTGIGGLGGGGMEGLYGATDRHRSASDGWDWEAGTATPHHHCTRTYILPTRCAVTAQQYVMCGSGGENKWPPPSPVPNARLHAQCPPVS